MKKSSRISAFCAALLLTVGLMVAGAPSASAVSCSGHGCDGKDPISTGCNQNAYLAKRYQIKDQYGIALWQAYVDVYYSNSCGTNWVRVTQNEFGGATYKMIQSLNGNGTPMYTEEETDYGYASSYSMMVYAPGSTKVRLYSKLFDTAGNVRGWSGEQTLQ